MTQHNIKLTSPRGRYVQGSPWTPNTTDQNGQPLVVKTGPNAGQPTQEWFMAVAYRKDDPETMPYLLKLGTLAAVTWPAFFPSGAQGVFPFGCTHPRFSFKIKDGDGVDDNGKPNRDKPGFAGCYVVTYSTRIQAPGVWQEPNFAEMDRVNDQRQLPRGYYVRISHTADTNENDQRPGLYVNLDKVCICADQTGAEVIHTGTTAEQDFGAGGGAAPAGGLVAAPGVDLAALRAAGWTDEQLVQHGKATRAAPPPAAPPATPPAGGIVANPGVDLAAMRAQGWTDDLLVQHGHATRPAAPPPPPSSPATPPPPPGIVANPGVNLDAMRAQGWTDDLLVQHGHATRPTAPPPPPPGVGGPGAATTAAPPPPTGATASPSNAAPPPPPYGGYMAAPAGGAAPPPPPPGAGAPPPPPPAGRVMLPAANGQTYEQMISSGWTDALLVQHGMMAA